MVSSDKKQRKQSEWVLQRRSSTQRLQPSGPLPVPAISTTTSGKLQSLRANFYSPEVASASFLLFRRRRCCRPSIHPPCLSCCEGESPRCRHPCNLTLRPATTHRRTLQVHWCLTLGDFQLYMHSFPCLTWVIPHQNLWIFVIFHWIAMGYCRSGCFLFFLKIQRSPKSWLDRWVSLIV